MSSQSCVSYHIELDFESDRTLLFSVINDVVLYCSNLYKEVLSIVSFFLPSCIINGTLVFLHYVLVGNPGIVFLLLQHKNLQPADVDFFTI